MSKEIEIGCDVIVLDIDIADNYRDYIGLTAKVTGYAITADWRLSFNGKDNVIACNASSLKRIDDDNEELSSWEAVQKDCKWNPTEVTA